MTKQSLWLLMGLLALCIDIAPVHAQRAYPASPIRLVLGFPPGATTDFVARLLAQKLAAQVNVAVVADNRPGDNGNLAADLVAKAGPEGYTLLFNTSGIVLSRAFGEKHAYDLFRDFTPVGLVASAPQLLVVTPSLPVSTVPEFTSYLKANPDKLAYASGGTGNISHLAVLLILQSIASSAVHVPYKGTGAAAIDLIANRVQFSIQSLTVMMPFVKDRRLRALAITGAKRSPLLPDVPALVESIPGLEIGLWYGVLAPVKTPQAVVTRLNQEINKAMQDADTRARLAQEGAEAIPSTPQQYDAYIKGELERWSKVIRTAGVKLE
jgi:tripartite-type tricarboxylate transporter receptor subunit TctC